MRVNAITRTINPYPAMAGHNAAPRRTAPLPGRVNTNRPVGAIATLANGYTRYTLITYWHRPEKMQAFFGLAIV